MQGLSACRDRSTGASERLKPDLEGLEPAVADDTEGLGEVPKYYPQAPGMRPSPAPRERVAEREARSQVRVSGSFSLPPHPILSPVLRGSFLGVLETGDEARRSLHMVLQRGGQFLAGHARLQLGCFRVEIGRHKRPGVMVPIGVGRRARPEIEPRAHQVLAADELR